MHAFASRAPTNIPTLQFGHGDNFVTHTPLSFAFAGNYRRRCMSQPSKHIKYIGQYDTAGGSCGTTQILPHLAGVGKVNGGIFCTDAMNKKGFKFMNNQLAICFFIYTQHIHMLIYVCYAFSIDARRDTKRNQRSYTRTRKLYIVYLQ